MDFPLSFYAASNMYATYEKPVCAPALRHAFALTQTPQSAKLLICGLGFYRLFVNGAELTSTLLAPYISNPDDILYYDMYELAPHLHAGENVIGLYLGNGMLNSIGGLTWNFDHTRYRGAPRVACTFTTEELTFDASAFVSAPSPIWFDDLRSGCFYDARKEQLGWDRPGFDDSAWTPVIRVETPRGNARLCDVDPIVCKRELSPVSIDRNARLSDMTEKWIHPKVTAYLEKHQLPETAVANTGGVGFDFGYNSAGLVRLKVKNPTPGQRIDLQFAEILDAEGAIDPYNVNRFYPHGYAQRDIYICRGDAEEIFVPCFTYHGFQYCYVTGLREDQIAEDTLTYLVCYTDLRKIGAFACSNETINRLQAMSMNSLLSNFYHFPTDCPHREKNGWTGDAALACEHALLHYDATRNYREWMHNICASQASNGSIPGVVPTGGWGFEWGNGPGWDSVLFQLPYESYVLRADRQIVEENATAMFRYLCYAAGRRDENGLLAYGLSDWCPCDEKAKHTPLAVTDTLIVMDCAKKSAYLFREIGKIAEAEYAEKLWTQLRHAFREHLVHWDTYVVAEGTQSAQGLALWYGIFTPQEEARAFAVLKNLIHENEDHMSGGCLGLRYLFHLLAEHGETELAYNLLMQPTAPSYRVIADAGYTTLPESITDIQALYAEPLSFNHHFFGFISGFFTMYLAGIRVNPTLQDASSVEIAPSFVHDLMFAEGEYETVAGKVRVRWERKTDTEITMMLEKADGVTGSVRLPDGWHFAGGEVTRTFQSEVLTVYRDEIV